MGVLKQIIVCLSDSPVIKDLVFLAHLVLQEVDEGHSPLEGGVYGFTGLHVIGFSGEDLLARRCLEEIHDGAEVGVLEDFP